ncbi:hypothetical protein JRO89_XS01G0364800 [Xanthoceras sorbifolium]|uniref:Uncharacterized protein n=1 Tax=Xanthoceras sorbifolium TaxID=99658 RepID=A0ABQ8INL8_9ROSI|nr:hypothetical protein JRO89_XS01G0364800 [Xanthoceras sorbifolium]
MSNSGGFAVTRTHSGDRFYYPPAMRRHQQLLFRQQQLQKEVSVDLAEVDTRADSDESTLSRPNSVCSASAASTPRNADLTNLDRLIDSVTPFVPAHFSSEARLRGRNTLEADMLPFFNLGDLWESFNEWSVYGVEVPLLLNGGDTVKQYYVPSLSGIQLYIDPRRLRRPGEDSDTESSREVTCSAGSSDHETERRAKGVDGTRGQHNLMNSNSHRLNRLSLRDKQTVSSIRDETEFCNSARSLIFEYFEQEQPHHRKPLYDKASPCARRLAYFASSSHIYCPDLDVCGSFLCAISNHASRFQVLHLNFQISRCAGAVIYYLRVGFLWLGMIPHTLVGMPESELSKNQPQFNASSGRNVFGVDTSSKISVPVFGLASYKLRNSILNSNGANEWQQAESLWEAADNWLRHLKANHPDFTFFVNHNSQRR